MSTPQYTDQVRRVLDLACQKAAGDGRPAHTGDLLWAIIEEDAAGASLEGRRRAGDPVHYHPDGNTFPGLCGTLDPILKFKYTTDKGRVTCEACLLALSEQGPVRHFADYPSWQPFCGAPKDAPRTDVFADVTCEGCREAGVVHLAAGPHKAACGAPLGDKATTDRAVVTCEACKAAIDFQKRYPAITEFLAETEFLTRPDDGPDCVAEGQP